MSSWFRAATSDDMADTVPLIYSSGPAAFDFVFSVPGRASALDFLRHAFLDGAGEFGFRNHVVGVQDGAVIAAGAILRRAAPEASGLPHSTLLQRTRARRRSTNALDSWSQGNACHVLPTSRRSCRITAAWSWACIRSVDDR
jgi:hypothetical protein